MFEIGKTYKLRVWEDTDDEGGMITELGHCKIVMVDMPLITYQQGKNEPVILNTASLAFVSAKLEAEQPIKRRKIA